MRVISASNVNEAYRAGLTLLRDYGILSPSRAGHVLVAPFPVVTSYERPIERVLFDARRDANPFFHLMESLWMLAGRNDARWLDKFVSNFSARFAEDSGVQHGAYGHRWRSHFMLDGSEDDLTFGFELDQLDRVVAMLKNDPFDRRVVIQMWDPEIDLGASARDVPCNLCVLPRIQGNKLDITVFCRSNDAIWGAYGANAVHFSVLQEYLAARIGVEMGTYYQISNNFHAYVKVFEEKASNCDFPTTSNLYKHGAVKPTPIVIDAERFDESNLYKHGAVKPTPIVIDAERFDEDLKYFFQSPDGPNTHGYYNKFFQEVAVPMFYSYMAWRNKDISTALAKIDDMPTSCDWKVACRQWYERRISKTDHVEEAKNESSK